VQTAESGMGEISNMILRMRELAVQMENGIYTSKDRDNAQLEINALLQEVDKIASNTKFNGVDLLDGAYDQTIRAGNTNAETIRVSIDGLKGGDTGKITEFAVETAIADTGFTITGDYANVAAMLAASATDDENISTDGADGADADGTDTDIEVLDGVRFKIDTSVFSTAFKSAYKADSLGTFSLTSVANSNGSGDDATVNDHQLFKVDAKTGVVTTLHTDEGDATTTDLDYTASLTPANAAADLVAAKANFLAFNVVYTDRSNNIHTERINLTVKQATESQLDDIEVETSAKATRAVETLDKALEEVSTAQAKLGAIRNRLTHNIDNLSKGSMLTEQSVGRIVDADFATETSELSKQQILAQAATSMLAQANQSKQSVLALLQ
jgi:flagellin